MKKFLPVLALTLLLGFIPKQAQSQTLSVDRPLIWGTSPFQDSLWAVDTTNWSIPYRLGPTLAGFTITGMTGLATDPTTGLTYVVMKVSSVAGRVLGTIDLMTGVCTQIGNLGDNFSSITFSETGQMYGATGDGAAVPEALYMIDKTNASKTLMYTMGNGADGEVICYNRTDDNIYHWSGNGTVIMERFPVSNVTYAPVNIPTTGTAGGETFGMLYNGPTTFILSNISSNLRRLSTSGAYDPATLHNNPDDLRGLVMLPYFNASDDSICQNETVTIIGGGHQQFSHLYFHWGDGSSDSIDVFNGTLTPGTHMYSAPGAYTIEVETYNGFGGDTVYTFVIQVNNIPTVAISGFSTVCSGDSVTLTGTSGGTSQWYMNGSLIIGATTNTYSTDQPGVYNMIKTNLNGCGDSAAVGATVIIGTNPVITMIPAEGCGWVVLDANFTGGTYVWSSGGTSQLDTVMSSGTYTVTVTDSVGCVGMGAVTATVNPLPIVNAGPDTTVCGSILLDAGNPGSSYLWCDGSTTQTIVMFSSGACQVMVTDTNGCTGMDTVTVIVNPNPTPNLGPDTSNCTSVTLSDPALVGGTYVWCNLTTGPSTIISSTGTCELMYTDSNGCVGYDTINVTIYGNPTVTASASDLSVCADDADVVLTGSPAGGTFTGTSVAGNLFDPSVGAGNYSILYTFTDVNGCTGSDSTISITVSPCVGIEENNGAAFTLFPNPSTGVLNINLTQDGSTVEVYDVMGNLVSSQNYINAGTVQLNMAAQAEGVYFVRVTVGTTQSVQKVLISK